MTDFNLTLSKEGALGIGMATTIATIGTLVIGAHRYIKKAQELEKRSMELLEKETEIKTREAFASTKKGGKNENE